MDEHSAIIYTEKDSQSISDDDLSTASHRSNIPLETVTSSFHINGASFAWSPDIEPFLKDITVNIDQPELYMCIGPVASVRALV